MLSILVQADCDPGLDTLWRILRSGNAVSGCDAEPDSTLLVREVGEDPPAFFRRSGNILRQAGLPEQGLLLLSRARSAGGPQDSLLAESAEALLAMGRVEQAIAATYALEGTKPSAVLLRERAKLLSLVGMAEEARQSMRTADSLDPPESNWRWDSHPGLLVYTSVREDEVKGKVDPAFERRRTLQNGLGAGGFLATETSDTSTYVGRSLSPYAQVDWGGGTPDWRVEGSLSTWSVFPLPEVDAADPPWGVSTGLSLRRAWRAGWWSKIAFNGQRTWRGEFFDNDQLDGTLSSGWSKGSFSASMSHRQEGTRQETWVPSNSTSLSFGWAPSKGPRWSASTAMGWTGGRDARYDAVVPAVIWRTIGVTEGARLWRDDKHPPSWTLLDPVTGVPLDSAQMVSFYYGPRPRPVPAPGAVDFTITELRPSEHWDPSLSLSLKQALPWRFSASMGVSTGWRLWTQAGTILLVDPWTPLAASGELTLARDEHSGKLYLITDTKGGTFIPVDETRRRRDHWTTLSLTLSWTPLTWTSWQIGWQATETGTNVADIDSTVASRSSTWSASACVWW